jgi:hypothetical protein
VYLSVSVCCVHESVIVHGSVYVNVNICAYVFACEYSPLSCSAKCECIIQYSGLQVNRFKPDPALIQKFIERMPLEMCGSPWGIRLYMWPVCRVLHEIDDTSRSFTVT